MVVKRAGPVIGSEIQLDGPSISKSSGIKCLVIGQLMDRSKKLKNIMRTILICNNYISCYNGNMSDALRAV